MMCNKIINYDDFVVIRNSSGDLSRCNMTLLMIARMLMDKNFKDCHEEFAEMIYLVLEKLEQIEVDLRQIKEVEK